METPMRIIMKGFLNIYTTKTIECVQTVEMKNVAACCNLFYPYYQFMLENIKANPVITSLSNSLIFYLSSWARTENNVSPKHMDQNNCIPDIAKYVDLAINICLF